MVRPATWPPLTTAPPGGAVVKGGPGAGKTRWRCVASLLCTRRASEHGDLLRRWIDTVRMLLFQTESGCSKKRCSAVQEWGHVCSLEAQTLWRFRGIYQQEGFQAAFTPPHAQHLKLRLRYTQGATLLKEAPLTVGHSHQVPGSANLRMSRCKYAWTPCRTDFARFPAWTAGKSGMLTIRIDNSPAHSSSSGEAFQILIGCTAHSWASAV